MKFSNMSLSTKLFGGFIIVALISALIGFINLESTSSVNNTIKGLLTNRMPSTQYLVGMKEGITAIKAAQRTITIPTLVPDDRKRQYKRFDEAFKRIHEAMGEYSKLDRNQKEQGIWEKFLVGFENWETLHKKFVRKSEDIDNALATGDSRTSEMFVDLMKITMFELKDPFFQIESVLDELTEMNLESGHQESALAFSSMSTSNTITIILTVLSFTIAILLGFIITKNVIRKPINHLSEVFKKVIEGDFRSKIDIKNKDEIGYISELVNKLIDSRKEEIKDLLDRSEIMSESSNRLLQISERSAAASEELKEKTSVAASSSEEVSANISTVSGASEEMTSSVREISKNTNLASNISNEASQKTALASEVMDRLGARSTEIGTIVKIINAIAEQTNLLALNATIEAARAGESGKGFAVVASEVKDLAKETARATEDITQKIKMIQDESTNAIEVIKEIAASIAQVTDIANSIASAVEEQTVTTSEITRNLTEASKGASMVAESNMGISNTANDYRSLANQVKADADNLGGIAVSLKNHLLSSYKL